MTPPPASTTENLEVLITVKGYPNPSRSLSEAACIAGVRRGGGLIRLYPVPFRDLEDEAQFKKYQWVRVPCRKPRGDPRPETYRPNFGRLEVTSDVLPSTHNWRARKEHVLPEVAPSLCDIRDAQSRDGTSLGVFRPREVLDFDWEEEGSREWTKEELATLTQRDLFMTRERKLLEKIPFIFRYRFRCEDCRTKEPHHVKIIDWELAQQYRRFARECATERDALRKLMDNWLDNLCGPEKDTYFFTGNMQAHPGTFLILGVFWPPKQQQLELL